MAERWAFVADESSLEAHGRSSLHPITARAESVEGWVSLDDDGAVTGGELRVAVADLRTGNPLYDREFDGRLDARGHPELIATVDDVAGSPDAPEVHGTVTVKGVSAAAAGRLAVKRTGDTLHVSGEHRFDIRVFGLKPPRLLMLKVDHDVTVRLDATAVLTTG